MPLAFLSLLLCAFFRFQMLYHRAPLELCAPSGFSCFFWGQIVTCGRFFTGGTGKLRLPPSLALSWLPTRSLSFCSVLKNLINLPEGQHYHYQLLEKYFTLCDWRLPGPVTFCALGRSQATDSVGVFSSVAVNVGALGSLVIAGFWKVDPGQPYC